MLQCSRLLLRRAAAAVEEPVLLDGLVTSQQLLHRLPIDERSSSSISGSQLRSSLPPFLQRQYASWEGPPGGPPESKIRAVPFTVTPYGAEQTFDEHHAKSWLHKRPSGGGCVPACMHAQKGYGWCLI